MSFYGTNFNSGVVSSNGNLQFLGNTAYLGRSCPLPDDNLREAIIPYQDDLHTGNAGEGIFTLVSGTAPNRTFYIEWRTHYFGRSGTANFEIAFYENQPSFFDVFYGVTIDNGSFEESGVQASACGPATTFSCNQGTLTNGWTHTGTIAPIGHSDSWTFSANAGDSIVIRVGEISQTNAFTPRIRLQNPSAVQMASAQNSLAAEIAVTATNTGTFTVIVDDAVGASS